MRLHIEIYTRGRKSKSLNGPRTEGEGGGESGHTHNRDAISARLRRHSRGIITLTETLAYNIICRNDLNSACLPAPLRRKIPRLFTEAGAAVLCRHVASIRSRRKIFLSFSPPIENIDAARRKTQRDHVPRATAARGERAYHPHVASSLVIGPRPRYYLYRILLHRELYRRIVT